MKHSLIGRTIVAFLLAGILLISCSENGTAQNAALPGSVSLTAGDGKMLLVSERILDSTYVLSGPSGGFNTMNVDPAQFLADRSKEDSVLAIYNLIHIYSGVAATGAGANQWLVTSFPAAVSDSSVVIHDADVSGTLKLSVLGKGVELKSGMTYEFSTEFRETVDALRTLDPNDSVVVAHVRLHSITNGGIIRRSDYDKWAD